jgi:hypothetical protein
MEAQLKLTLCYVSFKMGTEKQEKHMVSITFLFTSKGHKTIWGTLSTVVFFGCLVLRLLSQFLRVFHKARYQITHATSSPETFVSFPGSFLTRPDTNSHSQDPTAGSDNFFLLKKQSSGGQNRFCLGRVVPYPKKKKWGKGIIG